MKSFKFSLQALRTLRQREEQAALEEYTQSLMARERALSQLDLARQELALGWGEFHKKLSARSAAVELAQIYAYCQRVDKRQLECEHAEKVARNIVHLAFTQLVSARQAREVIEKFHDAQKRGHDRSLRKQEQKVLDDLVKQRAGIVMLLELNRESAWN